MPVITEDKKRDCKLIVHTGEDYLTKRIEMLIEDGYDVDGCIRLNDTTAHYVLVRYNNEEDSWM